MSQHGEQMETAPLEKTFSFHRLMALKTCRSEPAGKNLAVLSVNTEVASPHEEEEKKGRAKFDKQTLHQL